MSGTVPHPGSTHEAVGVTTTPEHDRAPVGPDITITLPEAGPPERNVSRRYGIIRIGLVASDVACVAGALIAANVSRPDGVSSSIGWFPVLLVPIVWVAVFHVFALYAPEHHSAAEEFHRIIGASTVGTVLLALTGLAPHTLERGWIGLTWILTILLELATRGLWRRYLDRLRADGGLTFRTLIVGANEEAAQLAIALQEPGSGYAPLGFVASSGSPGSVMLPVVGSIDTLRRTIREVEADCVFVASSAVGREDMFRVAHAARPTGVHVRVSANLPPVWSSRVGVHLVGSEVALSLQPVRLAGPKAMLKRAFDLTASSLFLLLTFPLTATIALAIRFTSPGPILFRQERVTKGGQAFTVFKFRTMEHRAEPPVEDPDHQARPFFKLQEDPRVTRVGRFIRRYSLDELPQLLNVVKGDMSMVGPRPLPVEQVKAHPELLADRHEVPAGITGWWQTNGRSDVSVEEALRLDLFYIENWSLALDMYILLRTVGVVLGRRGAY